MEIAIIGAGSHFTMNLLRSMYQNAKHDHYHIRFMDIRPEALDALRQVTDRFSRVSKLHFRYSYHTEQKSALEGADHVLVSFAVDFPGSFLRTCWVLKNHGISYTEAETATPGALMATMRHLPPLLHIAEELKTLSNHAYLHIINNPLPRLLRGVFQGTGYTNVIGHCHGTVDTAERISVLTDTPREHIDLFVAGINHFHIVQRAVDRRNGKDLLASLKDLDPEKIALWQRDYSQWKVYEELNCFIGCGNWHTFDYVPYSNQRIFRHDHYNTWDRHNVMVLGQKQTGNEIGSEIKSDEEAAAFLQQDEREQMFHTMQALTGEREPYLFLSGNMPNQGRLADLPDTCIVELPSTVSTQGVQLHDSLKPIPLFFKNWLSIQTTIHELSVCAILENSRQAAIEAIACDPSFRDSDCSPGQLLDEMMLANEGLVPRLH